MSNRQSIIINKLASHKWYLTKKVTHYTHSSQALYTSPLYAGLCILTEQLFYFHLNDSTGSTAYLVLEDNNLEDSNHNSYPTLIHWNYHQMMHLPRKISSLLRTLNISIPDKVSTRHSQSNINNYHKENNLIKSAQNNLHSALFNNNGDLTYTDKQRVNQAKHLLQKTLKDRKWRHHQQKNVVVVNIDNFATNYTRDSRIFFLVRRPNDHSGICSTQKFSYNQLNYTPNIIFNDKDCARHQAELLSQNGTTAHVTTLKKLLDKYQTLQP